IDTVSHLINEGCRSVGFVSSSHNAIQIRTIIREIRSNGLNPIFVLNTNSYEKVETIRNYEGLIDVYLPDFKYSDNSLAKELSGVGNYCVNAVSAIKEMYRQKGLSLHVNNEGYAECGLIIRHLVLPGYVQNSIEVLRTIAKEISNSVHISLMSQYTPIPQTTSHPALSRGLTEEEYCTVVEEMEALGFGNGWIQELDSSNNYFPDFDKSHPFE
ncbi:MAG: radical SAM protein, partial [Bacteroidota bacterium]